MSMTLTAAPSVEPVTLAEAKAHLRVDSTAEDAFISSLIVTSRLQIEAALGLALVTQSWRVTIEAWPACGVLELPIRPVQSVQSVEIATAAGPPVTLAASHYHLDGQAVPARLVVTDVAAPLPGVAAEGIAIALTAGFGPLATDIPAPIRHAMLLLVAHWFEVREPVAHGGSPQPIPDTVSELLAPYRVVRL